MLPNNNKQLDLINAKLDQVLALLNVHQKVKPLRLKKAPEGEKVAKEVKTLKGRRRWSECFQTF